mgnify:CR=1 FL=1
MRSMQIWRIRQAHLNGRLNIFFFDSPNITLGIIVDHFLLQSSKMEHHYKQYPILSKKISD